MPLSYMYLKGELEYARHSGISAMKFLQCAFNLSEDELQELKKSIEDVPVHTSDEYSTLREKSSKGKHSCVSPMRNRPSREWLT